MKRATTLKEIIDHHFNGGKFQYESYDHAKAEAEFRKTDRFKQIVNTPYCLDPNTKIDKQIIPEDIRSKYAILKPGKLRSIDFAPDGSIRRVKIGNKRPMNFYEYSACKIVMV